MPDWECITARIISTGAVAPSGLDVRPVGGGCISSAYVLGVGGTQYFIKTGPTSSLTMFEAELSGLQELSRANSIRVPEPVCTGVTASDAFLVLEYLPLGGNGSAAQLGEQLAELHHHQQQDFGWRRDNTIGSTPQINHRESDWPEFWARHRLEFQLTRAQKKGAGSRVVERGQQLCENLSGFFSSYRPVASLLHGDLWSGNVGYLTSGEPVIFDPAVYYGDREADLAMTELFGGFPRNFYAAYQSAYPLDAGYAVRKTLYNLYHILNHYNLFGGGYINQAESMIDELLSVAGN